MGRPGITYSDVAKAAEALQVEGINPTIERVRAKLGTGSNGTITPYLRKWKSLTSDTEQLALKEQLPESFVTLMKSLWQHMLSEAQSQVDQIKQHSEETLMDLKQTLDELETQNQQGQQRYHQLQQANTQISRDKATLEAGLRELQQEKSVRAVQIEQSQKQLQEKQTHVDELLTLHKQAQENLEHYRESAREQRDKESQEHDMQINQLGQTVNSLDNQLTNEKVSKSTLDNKLTKMNAEHTQLMNDFKRLTNDYTALKQSADKDKHERATYKGMHQQLDKNYQQLQTEQTALQETSIELEKKLAATSEALSVTTEKNKDLIAQVSLLGHEKWGLGQEKAKVEGQLTQCLKQMS